MLLDVSIAAVYKPSNIPKVDALVDKYAGREAELNAVLRSKYGEDLQGNIARRV